MVQCFVRLTLPSEVVFYLHKFRNYLILIDFLEPVPLQGYHSQFLSKFIDSPLILFVFYLEDTNIFLFPHSGIFGWLSVALQLLLSRDWAFPFFVVIVVDIIVFLLDVVVILHELGHPISVEDFLFLFWPGWVVLFAMLGRRDVVSILLDFDLTRTLDLHFVPALHSYRCLPKLWELRIAGRLDEVEIRIVLIL